MVTATNAEDKRISIDKNGKMTIRREIIFEADSMDELAMSTALPRENTRHPSLTAMYLESVEVSQIGNKNRKIQALATLNYVSSTQNSAVMHFGGEPWELGAQNFSLSFIEQKKPLIYGYNEEGKPVLACLNSAGCRILAETTETVAVLSFMYSVKTKIDEGPVSTYGSILNKNAETVAGVYIPPLQGKLLPISANYVVEYEADGSKVKRRYWNYNVQIQMKPSKWITELLDVGTMCKFKAKNSEGAEYIKSYPENIYKYTPWKSADSTENLKVAPRFGSIDDVISAMRTYWAATGTSDKIPYEEITEPMPLRTNGTLYEEALASPMLYQYNTKKFYAELPYAWNQYNLPSERA